MAVDSDFLKNIKDAKYGTDMIGFFKSKAEDYSGGENNAALDFFGKKISGAYVPKPSPTMSVKASLSQFWNNLSDWFTFYWSPVKGIPMALDRKEEGYKIFEETIKDMVRMNQFLRHDYGYYADADMGREWLPPKEFFFSRWADIPGIHIDDEDIADDCEGTTWAAHHGIRVSNKVSVEDILFKLSVGKRENVIACCFSDTTGHAYNQHGTWSVGNWGRIDHGSSNPVVMGKDFISDANDFSYYVENEDATEAEYVEGGEAAFYTNEKCSVQKYLETVDKSEYAVLTGEIIGKLIGKIDRSNMELKDKAIEKYNLPVKGVMKLVNHEIRERTPIARKIADEIDVEIHKIAKLKLARV